MTDYASSGVNLDRAAAAKARIAAAARTTFGPQVLTDVGHFGGFFALNDGAADNVLVASADGVGTKLLLGIRLGKISGLGRDLVQHCINDILMCGARPLFFLDYMAFGKLDPDVAGTLAESLSAACREHGVALIGGETAEMPDLYEPGHFDLAGTIIGSVRRDRIFDGSKVKAGDMLIGLASNGLHTNGYSLVRSVFAKEIADGSLEREHLSDGTSLADALMKAHRCYLPSVGPLLDNPDVHALSHITGGGLEENTLRVIPKGLHLDVSWASWNRPDIYRVIQERGNVPEEEMRRVFNLGIGVVMVVEACAAYELTQTMKAKGEQAVVIGRVSA
ncbi:MAG TPA: phosphoribosylformylglycinamidine cyclo-ligase [bacterium]|jgi:phosphoribosylformylglycinamidine cyclo-ligase